LDAVAGVIDQLDAGIGGKVRHLLLKPQIQLVQLRHPWARQPRGASFPDVPAVRDRWRQDHHGVVVERPRRALLADEIEGGIEVQLLEVLAGPVGTFTDVLRDVWVAFAPVVRGIGVDQHHPRHVVRMASLVQPGDRTAEGPGDQHVRGLDLLGREQLLEVRDALVPGVEADVIAPAVVRAVVCAHAGEPRDLVEHVVPRRCVGGQPRFEDDGWTPLTAAVDVETAPPDIDHRPGRVARTSSHRSDGDEGEADGRLRHVNHISVRRLNLGGLRRLGADAEVTEEGVRILEAQTEALDRDREGAEATLRGRQEVEEDHALRGAVHEPALESKVGVDADRPHHLTPKGGSPDRPARDGGSERPSHADAEFVLGERDLRVPSSEQ
jgi:hypothetical protein